VAPIANAIVLPLLFISGVLIPTSELPQGMLDVASVFPAKPLFDSLLRAFDPAASGSVLDGRDVAVIAAWGIVGIALALRHFGWSPAAAGPRKRVALNQSS